MDDFDLTRCISSLDALEALCCRLPEGYAAEVAQNVEVLRADLYAADEQIAQLVRALRAEVEPPTFMGEPVTSGVPPAASNWITEAREAHQQALAARGVPASPAPLDRDRAHCLIYDLFINDDKMIRSMAAQDLKRLLGISGPVPVSHLGVQEVPRG